MLPDNNLSTNFPDNNFSVYKSILHQSAHSFVIINEEGKIIDVNSATEKLLGYTFSELIQLSIEDILFTKEKRIVTLLNSYQSVGDSKLKVVGKQKNQEEIFIEFTFITIEPDTQKPKAFCLFLNEINFLDKSIDKDNKDKLETISPSGDTFSFQELRIENELFRSFIDNLPFVVFQMNLYPDNHFHIGFVNKKMNSYSPSFNREAVNANNHYLFQRVHPDDKERLIESMRYKLPFSDWNIEYRIFDDNGEIRWTKGFSKPELMNDGMTVSSYTCLMDITESKLAEQRLMSERGLLRTLIDNLPVAVFVKDKLGRKLIANKLDVLNMGLNSEEEAYGKTDLEIFSHNTFHKGYQEDMHVLQTGKPVIEDPDVFYDRNGNRLDVLVSKFPFANKDNELQGLIGICRDITEQKRVEEQLKLVDFAFRNSAVSIFLVKEDASFYDINEMAQRTLGYTKDELMGLLIFDINPRADKTSWAYLWQELRKNGLVSMNSKGKKKDGTIIDVDIKSTFIKYGDIELNCAFVTDITEKKKTIEQLELADFIFRKVSTPIIVRLEDSSFLDFNQAALEMYGYTKDGMKLLKTEDLVVKADMTYSELWEKVKGQNKLEWESVHKRKDGTHINVHCVARFFVYGGKELCCTFIVDMTDRKKAELEKEQLVYELTQNNMELKQFSYITTHNLRAPLTNLIAIAKMLNTDEIANELTLKLIDGFKRSTFHLNETLNDLINILIIKENKNLATGNYRFQKILDKVVESIDSAIVNSQTIINADFSKAEEVCFNGAYLESIFLNLITNSIKYAYPGRTPIINIATQREKNSNITLTFSDNGSGMNMERVKNRIFGLYQRFHNNIDSKGIGLYLIHSQVTALGGHIKVCSEEQKGTIFTITFK